MKRQNALVQGVSILCLIGGCIGFLLGSKITTVQTVEEELSMPVSNNEVAAEVVTEIVLVEVPYIYYDESFERETKERAYRDYMAQFTEENAEAWWAGYNIMVENWEDPPEHITDIYTEAELEYLYRCVETETYDCDFLSKAHVAMVVFNRLEDPNKVWGNSLIKVITSPNQFAYGRTKITEQTKQACAFAFEMPDMVDGAVAFHSGVPTQKFGNRNYLLTDNCGHHFYK